VQSGRRLRILYGGSNFFTFSFNTDGCRIIASSFSNAQVWDAITGQLVKSYPTGRRFGMCSAMSPDSKLVAVGYNAQIRLLEADTGAELRRFWSQSGSISSARDVTFSPDGKTSVFASDDGTAKLFDVASGAELRIFKGDSQAISSVAFTRDGKWLAIGDKYRGVKLWEVNSPSEPIDLAEVNTAVYSLSFTADGKYLVTAGQDSTISLWDINRKKLAGTINFLGGAEWIASDEHGNFDGSEYCELLRTFRHGKSYSDLSKLSDRHWQPGLLGKLLCVSRTTAH
jgi:WD40 repeat protein